MYITTIIINNFKSYRGWTKIEEFTPGHSIIVGENGAGKSNFLEAIDFVLNFEDKRVRRKDIALLLHQRETDGFVEILFSGCDYPYESEIISIRKEFSLRANVKFYINNKQINQNKAKAFFEICGLQIMKPLSVTTFVNMSREELLMYVIRSMGATVFETYCSIQKTSVAFEGQKEKIDHLSVLIEELRITEDKEYLIKLEKYKKLKNIITAHILKRKIDSCNKKIQELEEDLSPSVDDVTLSSTISVLHHSHEQIHNMLLMKKDILEDLVNEKYRLIAAKEKLNFKYQDLLKLVEQKNNEVHADSERILSIENKIISTSKELETVGKELTLNKNIFSQLESQKDLKETIRLNLLSKLKRTQYLSEEERNTHIEREKSSLTEKIHDAEEEINVLSAQQEELLQNRSYLNEKIEELKNQLQQGLSSQRICQEKQLVTSLLNTLSDLRRNERILENEVSEMFQKIQEVSFKLKKKVGSAIIDGAESILCIIHSCRASEGYRWLIDSYYGMVVDNFECSEELSIAVETAVGKRLFSHIVTNNKIGTTLLKLMNEKKLRGEVTFLPIINVLEFSYDYPESADVEPILNRLKFKPNVARVMNFLFGHIMICRNIDVAIDNMKKNTKLTYVTLEGDRVTESALYGGYVDKSKCSRLLYLELNSLHATHSLKTENLENLRNNISKLESDVTKTFSLIQRLKEKIANTDDKDNLEKLIEEEQRLEKELLNTKNKIEKKKRLIKQLYLTKKMLINEISEDIEQINAEIMEVNKEIEEPRKLLNAKVLEIAALESKQLQLHDDLNHYRKLKDLQGLDTFELEEYKKKINDYSVKEEIVGSRLNVITNQIKETEKSIIEVTNEKLKVEEEIAEHFESETAVIGDKREKLTRELMICNQKLHEYESAYNELKYPSSLSRKFTDFTLSMLYSKLKNVNEILGSTLMTSRRKKINKTNAVLFEKFERLQNIFYKSYVIYAEFLEWFHSYVEKSLNDISDTFTENFKRITAGGEAYLFIDEDNSSRNWPALENMTGLQMCTQFSACGENWNLLGLSWGQKVQVNLALMFSILKVCSVPLCILDEIERPLNNERKRLICQKISEFRDSLQIFSSSHSKEWIKGGKTLYYITQKYMRSYIKRLTDREATDFLNTRASSGSETCSFTTQHDTSSSF